jgi:hypothetical protein
VTLNAAFDIPYRLISLMVTAGCLAVLGGAETAALPFRLRLGEIVPSAVAGELTRLADGARVELRAGEPLQDLLPGAYRRDDRVVIIRPDDSAAGHAISLVGLPVLALETARAEEDAAVRGEGFNAYSLPVQCWRLADGWPWPWVIHGSYWGGLAGLCWRIDGRPHAYVPGRQGYVTRDGSPLPVIDTPPAREPEAVRLGDLVVAKGLIGVLVRDLGQAGVLDPADEVVTASLKEGDPARVRVARIGDLFGDAPVDLFTRDRPRGEARAKPPPDPDNPLHQLPLTRQWVAAGGMFVLCALLLFRLRRLRQKRKERDRATKLMPPRL